MADETSDATQAFIGGVIPVGDVIRHLRRERPVFHSEADLQHAFARVLWQIAPDVQVRLEVRQAGPRREHLDLLCIGPSARTAVEFKYFTRPWTGTAGDKPEPYALRAHAAADLARRNFVFDIARLESYCREPEENGLALIVTNAPALWTPPSSGARRTRDHEFRIHDGRTVTGTLLWAEGRYKPATRTLRGTYRLAWEQYSRLTGSGGELRVLAVCVRPPSGDGSAVAETASHRHKSGSSGRPPATATYSAQI